MNYTYSFIIPHHGNPALLNRCLESIPIRDDIQVIVVDDNSPLASQPQISRAGVETIYINALQSKGAGHARNVGLEKAKGKWLLFADCDDFYTEGFLEVLDQYVFSDIEILFFNYNIIDEVGIYDNVENKVQKALKSSVLDKEQKDIVRFRNNSPWDKMVKREFVVANNIRFEETSNGNDILFNLKINLFSTRYSFIPDKLYNYIIQENSISTRKQSVEDVVCRIEHDLKKFKFNEAIGHPEWKICILVILYGVLKDYGLFFALSVFARITVRFMNGNFNPKEWASMV